MPGRVKQWYTSIVFELCDVFTSHCKVFAKLRCTSRHHCMFCIVDQFRFDLPYYGVISLDKWADVAAHCGVCQVANKLADLAADSCIV